MSEREVLRAVDTYTAEASQLRAFVIANQGVIDTFLAHVTRRNEAIALVKGLMRGLNTKDKYVVGPFTRSKVPIEVVFDPAKMPMEVLALPGVVKKVDTKVMDELLKRGQVEFSLVQAARSEEEGTARITGPSEVVVEL